jgi:hypothetical protein
VERRGEAAREAEELVHPAPGATDLIAGLGSGLVLAAYLVGGPAAAARAVALAALPAALLPLVSARCRRYAVFLYAAALSAVLAGLFCCALDPLFLAAAAFAAASFAWTHTQRARGARMAQGLQSLRK